MSDELRYAVAVAILTALIAMVMAEIQTQNVLHAAGEDGITLPTMNFR